METKELIPWNWFKKSENSLQKEWDRDLNKTFEDFFNKFSGLENMLPRLFREDIGKGLKVLPRVDISENLKQYIVEVDFPGVKEEDIEISVSKDESITIKGEREQNIEQKDNNYYRLERSHGSFERTLMLPDNCDSDNIEASFKDGILTIKIAKKEPKPSEVKKIKISHSK